jgi:hypothetical protein
MATMHCDKHQREALLIIYLPQRDAPIAELAGLKQELKGRVFATMSALTVIRTCSFEMIDFAGGFLARFSLLK